MRFSLPSSIRRLCAAAMLVAALVGCNTAPPQPVPAPEAAPQVVPQVVATPVQVAELKQLGFQPGEAGLELSIGTKLLFDTDSDGLSTEGRQAIADLSKRLSAIGLRKLRVEGHTDNTGSSNYNAELSLRRALAVSRELMKYGFTDDDIQRIGYGEDKPVADNASAQGRAQNRRVVITVAVQPAAQSAAATAQGQNRAKQ